MFALLYTCLLSLVHCSLISHQSFNSITHLTSQEFDHGDGGLAKFLKALKTSYDQSNTCDKAPVILGANIVPNPNSPLLASDVPQMENSSVVILSNGEKVGLVGIDIKLKVEVSSKPDEGTHLLDERETAQAEIDALIASGVNKIVLLTHVGYMNDVNWMAELNGVDVVVGGGSHTLLASEKTEMFGTTNPTGPYATIVEKEDGSKVCVVQAWCYSQVVGNLQIDFDEEGKVLSCEGMNVVPVNPDFVTNKDHAEPYELDQADAKIVIDGLIEMSGGQARPFDEDKDTANDLSQYLEKVGEYGQETHATVPTTIPLEINRHESGAADFVVEGFLLNSYSAADVALAGSGSVRVNIEVVRDLSFNSSLCNCCVTNMIQCNFHFKGDFNTEDAYTLLPFGNFLVNIVLTGQQIKSALEDGLDYYLVPNGSTGAYPKTSGLRFHVNEAMKKGSRISNMEINPALKGEWAPLDMLKNYTLVTTDYIASGKDGYYEFEGSDYLDLGLEYAASFIDYAKMVKVLEKVPKERASTQSWRNSQGEEYHVDIASGDSTPEDTPFTFSDTSASGTTHDLKASFIVVFIALLVW